MKKNISTKYTKRERSREVTDMIFQLCFMNMDWVLGETEMKHIFNYINNGVDYITQKDLPGYSAELDIRLVNSPLSENYINLNKKKIKTEDPYLQKLNEEGLKNLDNVLDNKQDTINKIDNILEELDDNDLDNLVDDMDEEELKKLINNLEK